MKEVTIIMPITGTVTVTYEVEDDTPTATGHDLEMLFYEWLDTRNDDVQNQCDETLEWEFTPYVTRGNVCYAHPSRIHAYVEDVEED